MKKTLQTFRSMRYVLTMLVVLLLIRPVFAQTPRQTIKGVILDTRNKQPIPGAVIRLAGTTYGTATDINGAYTLTVNVKDGSYNVMVTFTGYRPYSQTVNLNQAPVTLNANLSEDALSLNEVVVTGTAVATTKKQLGNAISTVSGRDLQNGAATSIDQALSGKIAGAQISQNSGNPAGGISVRLRGNSTISGSSDPLYIVDGVIINNSSDQLIDLGGYSQNRLVDINPADIDHIEITKGAAASAIYGSRASNGVVQIFTKRGKAGKPAITFSTEFRDNSVRKKLAYNTYPYRFTNTIATDLTQVPVQRYDLQSMIFRNGIGSENNVSVSGGSENTQYYMSSSYLTNQGIIKNSDFQRGGVRARIDQRFNNWLKASVGLNYILDGSREIPNGGINEAYGALTGFIFANNYINPAPDPVTGIYPSVSPTAIVQRTNPLEAINRFDFTQKTSRLIGDINLTATPTSNLVINYTLGYDNSTQLALGYIPINNTTPTYNTGYSRRADRLDLLLNNDLNIAYKANIASWLTSATGAGATAQTERINTSSITGTQLSPYSKVSTAAATINALETRSTLNILGFYLQETLGFGNRLYLTGAIRNDVSSSFGINNRWQYYPKASASYLLSEEKFWKNSSIAAIIPTLKIRASYGQSGNLTAIGAYDRFNNYASVSLAGLPGDITATQQGNPDIKPERQTEKEIGVDASFLNDRLGFEVSYYDKSVKDLLLFANLRPSTGYLNQYQNVGDMTNKGIEVLLRGNPIQNEKFKWTSTIIYSRNRNKVFNVPGGLVTFPGGFGQVAAVNGYALGAFYATYFARNADGSIYYNPTTGLPTTEKVGRDANGNPTGANKLKVIGDPNPKWTGSWANNFEVGKNWSFRFLWDGAIGGQVFNFTRRVGQRDLYGGLKDYEAELKGQVPKGYSAAVFSIFENFIEDGSYVKLREVSASYTLRSRFLGNKPLRITLSGRNLFSIDKYSGWDPETNAAGQSTAVRGFDFVEVPIPRTIALGLNYSL